MAAASSPLPLLPVPAAYGADFGPSRLVVAKSVRGKSAACVFDGAPDAPEAAQALKAIRAEVLAGRAALAIAAPPEATFVRQLKTPLVSAQKAARVWKSLLDLDLPFPVEQAAVFAAPPKKAADASGLETLAAAIRADDLAAALDAAEAAGLPPTHADALAPALYDQLARTLPPARPDAPRALVWIGDGTVAVACGRGPAFHAAHLWRNSPLGPAGLDGFLPLWRSRATTYLELPPPSAETNGPLLDVYFAGPGATDDNVVQALSKALSGGVRTTTIASPRLFLACALAERAGAARTWQLRTSPVPEHPAWATRNATLLKKSATLALALAMVVIGLDLVILARRSLRLNATAEAIAEAAKPLSSTPLPRGHERLLLKNQPSEAAANFALASRLSNPAPDADQARLRLHGLLQVLGDYDLRIQSLTLGADAAFTLEAAAAAYDIPDRLSNALSALGWTVQAAPAPAVSLAGNATFASHPYAFTLKAAREEARP